MRNPPPTPVVYGACTYDQALDIVWELRLKHCEPDARPVTGVRFMNDADLTSFALVFRNEVLFERDLAMVFPPQQDAVEAFIERYEMQSRITRYDLLAVWFWDARDRTAFERELGFSPE